MVDNKWLKMLEAYDLHCQKVVKSTRVDITEKPADQQKRIANLLKDYITWFEYYFPHYAKKKSAKYHKKLAKLIIGNNKVRLLAEIYRSGGKSVHIDMGIPLYLYVTGQLHFMLLIGEVDMKAKRLLGDIQSELEYNQRFINDYGRKLKQGTWADGNFYTSDGVRFMSLGFGSSPRGLREGAQRPDYIVCDDVDTKKHVNNDRIMGDAVDYIMEDVIGCFDSDSSEEAIERFVYSNNNFHKNSITNRLKKEFQNNIKKDEEFGDKTDFEILTVCAVKDLVTFEPTWPEKTTADYWRKKYMKRQRSFLREYMHKHVQEGKIFKATYMQWKKMLPLDKYDALCFYGDLSYKDAGDFKAMILVGRTAKEIHIIHTFLRQSSRKRVAEWVYDLYERRQLHKYNIKYKIEGLFAMDEFVSDFDTEGEIRGYYIAVVADKRGKANKYDRIESCEGEFERLWVWFNEAEKETIDQIELVDQFLGFEKGSSLNDDGPDAYQGGKSETERNTFQEKFETRITLREKRNQRF